MLREEDQMINVGLVEKNKKKGKMEKVELGDEENDDVVASQSGISTEGPGHLQGSGKGFLERRKHEEERREKKRKKMVEEKLLEEKADVKKRKAKVADEYIAGDHDMSLDSHVQPGNSEDSNGNCHQKEKNEKNQDWEKQAGIEDKEKDSLKGDKEKPKEQRWNNFHEECVEEHTMCTQGTGSLENDLKSPGQTRVSENAEVELVSDGTGATSRKIMKKNKKDKRSKGQGEGKYHSGEKKEKIKHKKGSSKLKGVKASSKSGKKSKHVSFADSVEVFPFVGAHPPDEVSGELQNGLIMGKRFTKKEDAMIMEAIERYINERGLGESGWEMVMHCKKYPEIRGCWKEIGAAMPWRPHNSIYIRAHILYESHRSELRKWTDEELQTVLRYVEVHGKEWRKLSDMLGKHRFHVKDLWRRNKSSNFRKGPWSQEEYQQLFDMVNLDLQTRASAEKDTKYGMLRDNIAWEAISDRLATRNQVLCCLKWYKQLASPLVKSGLWANIDDHFLLGRLLELDACNVDDVDWDNLLDNRSGELCRNRWQQMTRHIGDNRTKSFQEQVHLLVSRYCPKLLE